MKKGKKCIHCGAGHESLSLLNPEGEVKGEIVSYYFRCKECQKYFKEFWVNEEYKTVLATWSGPQYGSVEPEEKKGGCYRWTSV